MLRKLFAQGRIGQIEKSETQGRGAERPVIPRNVRAGSLDCLRDHPGQFFGIAALEMHDGQILIDEVRLGRFP